MNDENHANKQLARLTRRSFLVGLGAAASGVAGWQLLTHSAPRDGIPGAFRSVLEFNGSLWSRIFPEGASAPEYEPIKDSAARLNGDIGLTDALVEDAWRLQVLTDRSDRDIANSTIEEIRALPSVEETIEFKCIEGWSQKMSFRGARFSTYFASLTAKLGPGRFEYVGLQTPDAQYYVSLDLRSMLHPQTLLCYEMNGQPLTSEHGAPLRLLVPSKYGIKNLKKVGAIRFSNVRPPDFWAERGYDWYAQL